MFVINAWCKQASEQASEQHGDVFKFSVSNAQFGNKISKKDPSRSAVARALRIRYLMDCRVIKAADSRLICC